MEQNWTVEREYNSIMVSDDGVPVCTMDGPVDDNQANAKLIAAAPDLLASCQEMEKYMTDCGYFGGRVPQHPMAMRARSAIHKATSK
jgi:hypothetical protein